MRNLFYLSFLFIFTLLFIFLTSTKNSETKETPVLIMVSLKKSILRTIAKDSLLQEREKVKKEFEKDNLHIKSFTYNHVDSSVIFTIKTANYQFLQAVPSIPKKEMEINFSCNKFTLYRMAMVEHELEKNDVTDFSVSGNPAKFNIILENNSYNLYFTYNISLIPPKEEKPKVKVKEPVAEKPIQEENTVYVYKTDSTPIIDGKESDKVWEKIPFYSIPLSGKLDVQNTQVKAIYTAQDIFFLFKWKDTTNNYLHKVWLWDKKKNTYMEGNNLEDRLVIKFAKNSDFAACPEEGINSKADVWDWRSALTNPSGYADNKKETISLKKIPRSYEIKTKDNNVVWLQFSPDDGTSPYRQEIATKFVGESIPQFVSQKPSGSRADVIASGLWDKEYWTAELSRQMGTQDKKDIQFNPKNEFYFALAIYDHSQLSNHNYSRRLTLKFK